MKLQVPEGEVHYEDEGKGQAILFLHAFPLGLSMWEDQAKDLRSSHRVLRFDGRGFGGSTPGDSPLTMDTIADDAARLMDHLGIQQAVVWGCSMGGYASLAFARRHGKRLLGLVLQDTRAGADTEEARKGRGVLAERVLSEGPSALEQDFAPKLLGATTKSRKTALLQKVLDTIRGNGARGIANALLGLGAREDSTPSLASIQVPTLILCGAEDVLTPPSESEKMKALIGGSRLEIIPFAGHLANMEEPAVVARVAKAFLRELG